MSHFPKILENVLDYQHCLMAITVLRAHGEMEVSKRVSIVDVSDWLELPEGSTLFRSLVSGLGVAIGVLSIGNWQFSDPLKFRLCLLVAAVCSGPWFAAATSQMLMLVAVLYGMGHLSRAEDTLVGAMGPLLSAFWGYGINRRGIEQGMFRTGLVTLGIVAGEQVFHGPWLEVFGVDSIVRFVFTSVALFLANTVPLALLYALRDGEPFVIVWERRHLALFPYYMGSALLAQILALA